MPSASGPDFGSALRRALNGAARQGVRKSYQARGWRAQLRQIDRLPVRGTAALEAAGLSPSRETRRRWANGSQRPSAANRAKIQEAYDILAGREEAKPYGELPPELEHGVFAITGTIDSGDRVEDRTLVVGLSHGFDHDHWETLVDAWMNGDDDDLWDAFGDLVADDLGVGYWGAGTFSGGSYTVSIR